MSGTWWLGHVELFATAYVGRDPVTYAKAWKSKDVDEWQKACQYEIDTLHKNNTWELVNLPAGHKAVKSKWVFKLKANGCFHTQLVAKGFMQIPGIDYDETFSPITCFESLQLLLALSLLIVILYVDDITIMGTSLEAVKWLKDDLQKHYEMSDFGKIESYLGICIT